MDSLVYYLTHRLHLCGSCKEAALQRIQISVLTLTCHVHCSWEIPTSAVVLNAARLPDNSVQHAFLVGFTLVGVDFTCMECSLFLCFT